jgi:hypothetical protein
MKLSTSNVLADVLYATNPAKKCSTVDPPRSGYSRDARCAAGRDENDKEVNVRARIFNGTALVRSRMH